MWSDFLTATHASPERATVFYLAVAGILAIPMKLLSRLMARVPIDLLNRDVSQAIVTTAALAVSSIVCRVEPMLNETALWVGIGSVGLGAVLSRKVVQPIADKTDVAIDASGVFKARGGND